MTKLVKLVILAGLVLGVYLFAVPATSESATQVTQVPTLLILELLSLHDGSSLYLTYDESTGKVDDIVLVTTTKSTASYEIPGKVFKTGLETLSKGITEHSVSLKDFTVILDKAGLPFIEDAEFRLR